MEISKKDILYNLDYVVCVPNYDKEIREALEYSFGNIYFLENNIENSTEFLEFIKKNNIKSIIFVDFLIEYINIIKSIDTNIEIKFIYTLSMAYMSNEQSSLIFNSIIDLYKKNVFTKLGIFDKNLYITLKNANMEVYHIVLDIEIKDIKKLVSRQQNIGILNNDFDPNHSLYNELSALTLTKNHLIANLHNPLKETVNFMKTFNISYKCFKKKEEIYNAEVNLYVNFTNTNNLNFIKSMDEGVPCIMGNTNILDEYEYLKEQLVIKSDDDIDEISLKIDNVIANKIEIMREYIPFRKEYFERSKKSIKQFLDCEIDNDKKEDSPELLLSVIVPVYNTEKYIKECLDSIEKARISSMEIIIINDGSSDNSEEVIKKYMVKHKNNIRYIKQENHGLGNVRNVGVENAKGKYIASVDSDDTIDKRYFKEAEQYLKNNIDMVICDWMSIYSNGDRFETSAKDYIFSNINEYKGILYTTIMPSTCNKIIRKSIIKDLGYKYAEGLKYEDLSLTPLVLLKSKTMKYINKPYYEYKIRENSIMRTGAGYNMIDIIKMLDTRVNEQFNEKDSPIDLKEFKYYTYFWRTEEFIFNQLYDLQKNERKEIIKYIKQNLIDVLSTLYSNKYYLKRISILDKNIKKYLNERNKEFLEGDLNEFLEKCMKENRCEKLTPPLIYYGKN